MHRSDQIRTLINRLARLDAAETWGTDLNPAQIAALEYLARANRFSRAPSHVAEYLGTTRGTMSQTLKALERKGYVSEKRSQTDKRSISYELTGAGHELAAQNGSVVRAIDALSPDDLHRLDATLSQVLAHRLAANNGRTFGICKACIHNRPDEQGAFCALLSVPLVAEETSQICQEQVAA